MRCRWGLGLLGLLIAAAPAWAVGPLPNATPIAERVHDLYQLIFWITLAIFLGVWGVLAIALWRFRHRPDRVPEQVHGNLWLEVVWTVLPAIALIVIAVPTYQTMRFVEEPPTPDLRLEVIGHQWYWEYRFPDLGLTFMNAPLVLPARKAVHVVASSADVVHSWSVPDFGFKLDTIPGHVNSAWIFAKAPGVHQGYCAQLCGTLHAQMLTQVHVVEPADFDAWVVRARSGQLAPPGAAAAAAPVPRGQAAYLARCAACHQANGQGVPGAFPPIAGAELPNGPAAEHIRMVLEGRTGPLTVKGQLYNGVMPPFASLSDAELADLISYERTAWGNRGTPVTPADVRAQRGK